MKSKSSKAPKSTRTREPQTAAGLGSRKRYVKPEVIAREPLEVVAAACVPQPPGKTPGLCSFVFS